MGQQHLTVTRMECLKVMKHLAFRSSYIASNLFF